MHDLKMQDQMTENAENNWKMQNRNFRFASSSASSSCNYTDADKAAQKSFL